VSNSCSSGYQSGMNAQIKIKYNFSAQLKINKIKLDNDQKWFIIN